MQFGKETQLIIATYDAGSPKEYRGSFAIVDLMSKEVTVHQVMMGKCVVAKGYDSNPGGKSVTLGNPGTRIRRILPFSDLLYQGTFRNKYFVNILKKIIFT